MAVRSSDSDGCIEGFNLRSSQQIPFKRICWQMVLLLCTLLESARETCQSLHRVVSPQSPPQRIHGRRSGSATLSAPRQLAYQEALKFKFYFRNSRN